MIASSHFVTSPDEFAVLKARAERIFMEGTDGLPTQVFRNGFRHFRFVNFDKMLSPAFWVNLTSCAKHFGDQDVCLLLHRPDPYSYYFRHFGRFGALRFGPSTSSEEYFAALDVGPKDSPADAIRYVGNVVSWHGNSCAWGFWGERDLGIGVAATNSVEDTFPHVTGGVRWLNFSEAIEEISLNFKSRIIPPSFVESFRLAYGKSDT
jgi:hypothetical protein